MAVPKSKISKSRRGMRQSQKNVRTVNISEDKTTGELKRRHHVAPDGFYKGRQVTTDKVNP